MEMDASMPVLTPDDLMAGRLPSGNVVVYDDDHYYMGGVLTELLIEHGCHVTFVTPSAFVSEWTRNTFEQHRVQARFMDWGVDTRLSQGLESVQGGYIGTACTYSGRVDRINADALVLVTSRAGNDALWRELNLLEDDWADAGIHSVRVFGDAQAPAPIAWATYAGHRYARELDEPGIGDRVPFNRELTRLDGS